MRKIIAQNRKIATNSLLQELRQEAVARNLAKANARRDKLERSTFTQAANYYQGKPRDMLSASNFRIKLKNGKDITYDLALRATSRYQDIYGKINPAPNLSRREYNKQKTQLKRLNKFQLKIEQVIAGAKSGKLPRGVANLFRSKNRLSLGEITAIVTKIPAGNLTAAGFPFLERFKENPDSLGLQAGVYAYIETNQTAREFLLRKKLEASGLA